jgi:hypothetical protein
MRRIALMLCLLAVPASVAAAHNTKYSWTAAKANVMLPDAATITLPPDLASSLEAEITPLIEQLKLLQLTAQQKADEWLAEGTYANYIKRLTDVRDHITSGLSIDAARCAGVGKPVKAKTVNGKASKVPRYKHFRCVAWSYVLEVPTIEIQPDPSGGLPKVIESPIRRYGPYTATFTLHVTGPSRMISKRLR